MKPLFFFKFLVLPALLLVMGCRQNSPPHPEGESHPRVGAHYKEGKGLELSEETQKALGLEIVEVGEETLPSSLLIEVQVYREAHATVVSKTVKPHAAYVMGILKKDEANSLKVGQPVALELKERARKKIEGSIVRLNASSESILGGIEILIEIPDPQHQLQVGTTLQARLSGSNERVTAIPSSSILKTATGTFVYVVNGQYLFRIPVQTGSAQGELVEIKDGLYAGDQVVKQPVLSLWMAELQAIKAGKACADGH